MSCYVAVGIVFNCCVWLVCPFVLRDCLHFVFRVVVCRVARLLFTVLCVLQFVSVFV